jgi:Tfp pilus assembly protein PilX
LDEKNKAPLITSIIALVVSVLSAAFSGLQWREERQARVENENDQKAARQIAQAQAMTAERAVILQQRKQDPKVAKDESDLPKMAAINLAINLLPRQTMDADDFLALKQKTVSVMNTGRSTAYYVIAANGSSIDNPDNMLGTPRSAVQAIGIEPAMLSPDKPLSVSAPSRTFTAKEISAFRNGDASYYLFGAVQYQDVLQRTHMAMWCYEFHAKKGIQETVESKPCTAKYDKDKLLYLGERIEAESKWEAAK